MVLKTYGGYAGCQKRTEREIPLVILEPRQAPGADMRYSHAGG